MGSRAGCASCSHAKGGPDPRRQAQGGRLGRLQVRHPHLVLHILGVVNGRPPYTLAAPVSNTRSYMPPPRLIHVLPLLWSHACRLDDASADPVFVCERVCTSPRLMRRMGGLAKVRN